MTIAHKIAHWQAEQLARGLKPAQIALSPWDEEQLTEWMRPLLCANDPLGPDVKATKVFGLEIISTPEAKTAWGS